MNILQIDGLTVEVAGKRVLEDVNLEIPEGEVHVLFGPNGCGKTSLILSILGFSNYRVVSGKILFNGVDVTNMPINERVKLGIGIAFQNPPVIRGVKLGDILRSLIKGDMNSKRREHELAGAVNFPVDFLGRDLNMGFSGGEMKRSEILQVLAQKPKFVMLDEPDSGVDIENLELIGKVINNFLEDRSGLLITHLGYILRYVDVDKAHVLIDKTIACSGKPIEILNHILSEGYRWCEKCPAIRKRHYGLEVNPQP